MKKAVLFLIAILMTVPVAYAVPDLQLFIDGATYDWGTQTWITTSGEFDLYVISANNSKTDVIVSMAIAPNDNPADVELDITGPYSKLSQWTDGYAPIDYVPDSWNGHSDLPRHGIYPTWYREMHTGDYGTIQNVGDVQPNQYGNFWNPASGEGNANRRGQVKSFHFATGGIFTGIHFDAYTYNRDGSIDKFAPFSHDAGMNVVPEPATIALMGVGLMGIGLAAFKRRKR